jgi:hypothetical protein
MADGYAATHSRSLLQDNAAAPAPHVSGTETQRAEQNHRTSGPTCRSLRTGTRESVVQDTECTRFARVGDLAGKKALVCGPQSSAKSTQHSTGGSGWLSAPPVGHRVRLGSWEAEKRPRRSGRARCGGMGRAVRLSGLVGRLTAQVQVRTSSFFSCFVFLSFPSFKFKLCCEI